MISNCDFLSSDIVISKSASGVRGPRLAGLVSTLWTVSGSGSKWASHLISRLPPPSPGPGCPALLSLLAPNSLYSAGDGNVARSSHWPPSPHKPEKARQSHLVITRLTSDRMKSWEDFVTVARAACAHRPHHTITKIFYMLHHHRSSAYRPAVSAWLSTLESWDCNNNPARYWAAWPGVIPAQVFSDEDLDSFRVFRVTSASNYRSMSGDCETLPSRAAVIKAIRDKFPTRAL